MDLLRSFVFIVMVFQLSIPLCWANIPQQSPDSEKILRQEFESRCPKPQWWDRVSISGVTIQTYDDLLTYWQDKNRSKSQFFKAAYQGILEHPTDTDIVVNAINLMHNTQGYPYRIELQEYAIKKYFSYKSPYGKPGDTVAGIVKNVAQLYNRTAQYNKSVSLIERLLKEREMEINDHLLELIHLTYADSLHGQNNAAKAIAILKKADAKYNGSWEHRIKNKIKRYEESLPASSSGSSVHTSLSRMKEPLWSKQAVFMGMLVLAVLLIAVLRRTSEQRSKKSQVHPPHN